MVAILLVLIASGTLHRRGFEMGKGKFAFILVPVTNVCDRDMLRHAQKYMVT